MMRSLASCDASPKLNHTNRPCHRPNLVLKIVLFGIKLMLYNCTLNVIIIQQQRYNMECSLLNNHNI